MSEQTFGKAAREHWDELERQSQWREITADQYRTGKHDAFSAAYIVLPETNTRVEVWDVENDADEHGNVAIYTDHCLVGKPVIVPPDYPIEIW